MWMQCQDRENEFVHVQWSRETPTGYDPPLLERSVLNHRVQLRLVLDALRDSGTRNSVNVHITVNPTAKIQQRIKHETKLDVTIENRGVGFFLFLLSPCQGSKARYPT